jgi:hypothetical protein
MPEYTHIHAPQALIHGVLFVTQEEEQIVSGLRKDLVHRHSHLWRHTKGSAVVMVVMALST